MYGYFIDFYNRENNILDGMNLEENGFWSSKIDFNDPILEFDEAPLYVNSKFQLSKLHFLFANLGITHVFVEDKGITLGYITKNEFIKLKK